MNEHRNFARRGDTLAELNTIAASEKDRAAAESVSRWIDFNMALGDKRKYPLQSFRLFVQATRRYIDATKGDELLHRSVLRVVNGLTDFLRVERKRVPGVVLQDAERLECLLFGGYDPYFEGDEPPGF